MFCLVFLLEQFQLHLKVLNFVLESLDILIFDRLLVRTVFKLLDFIIEGVGFDGRCHVKALQFFLRVNGGWRRDVDSIEALELG
jgi:hypothetical protein